MFRVLTYFSLMNFYFLSKCLIERKVRKGQNP